MSKQRGQTINGAVLRLCREKLLKANIATASKRLGVTASVWSKWELGGRRISDENLELLVDLFGLDDATPLLAQTAFAAEEEAERNRLRRTTGAAA